ncbi:hypothetical protein NLU13_9942 [Sarocladium strictum]|uniref:Uncharacterized protein n=1 Tax=Sarocladium strictum TaxID=5046 RepID=A0AA39L3J4_SARSR|nr:hypothetical protein NLU13_9942 [Sarocladium strictum]
MTSSTDDYVEGFVCTLETCSVKEWGYVQYQPSIPGNAFFLALMALFAVVHVVLGWRYKITSFTVCMVLGLLTETLGYASRILLHGDPFKRDYFLTHGNERLANIKKPIDLGTNILVAGLSIQVASLFFFLACSVEFLFRASKRPDMRNPKFTDLANSTRFKTFLVVLLAAALFLFARTVYRAIELSEGFTGDLANDQVLFMVLDGAMVILCTICLTFMHPGHGFGGRWHEAVFYFRSPKMKRQTEDQEVHGTVEAGAVDGVKMGDAHMDSTSSGTPPNNDERKWLNQVFVLFMRLVDKPRSFNAPGVVAVRSKAFIPQEPQVVRRSDEIPMHPETREPWLLPRDGVLSLHYQRHVQAHPMARTITIVAAIAATVPLIVSSFYLYRLHDRVSSKTTRSNGRFSSSSSTSVGAPKSLPAHVAADPDGWVIHYERVASQGVPVSDLTQPLSQGSDHEPSLLLQRYMQNSHYAFSRTPQAFVLGLVIKDVDARRTFSPQYIRTLEFHPGQRVNGAYTVVYVGEGHVQGSGRVELALDPPKGYHGPAPQGRIISEVLPARAVEGSASEDAVVFVNETWMWRKQHQPKTLLEGGLGAWLHALTSGWLILQGLRAVHKLP